MIMFLKLKVAVGLIVMTILTGSAGVLLVHTAMAQDATPAATQPADAAVKLRLLEDFSDPEVSQEHWIAKVAGTGNVKFERGRVVLAMPAGDSNQDSPVNLVHLISKTPVRLARVGDTVRLAWNMQLLDDPNDTYGFGPCIGDRKAQFVVVGQAGHRGGNGTPHDFFVPGMPEGVQGDGIDHGVDPLHYDMTVTLEDAQTGQVRVELTVWAHRSEYDGTPEAYVAKAKPIAKMTGKGEITAGEKVPVYFCILSGDAAGDQFVDQARGSIAVDHVYLGESAGAATTH